MIPNTHPVDALARIRAEIKNLTERENQLRQELISGRCGLEGDENIATIAELRREWVSLREARHALGEILDPYITEKSVKTVRITPKAGSGDAE
jgi:hypothetical protein